MKLYCVKNSYMRYILILVILTLICINVFYFDLVYFTKPIKRRISNYLSPVDEYNYYCNPAESVKDFTFERAEKTGRIMGLVILVRHGDRTPINVSRLLDIDKIQDFDPDKLNQLIKDVNNVKPTYISNLEKNSKFNQILKNPTMKQFASLYGTYPQDSTYNAAYLTWKGIDQNQILGNAFNTEYRNVEFHRAIHNIKQGDDTIVKSKLKLVNVTFSPCSRTFQSSVSFNSKFLQDNVFELAPEEESQAGFQFNATNFHFSTTDQDIPCRLSFNTTLLSKCKESVLNLLTSSKDEFINHFHSNTIEFPRIVNLMDYLFENVEHLKEYQKDSPEYKASYDSLIFKLKGIWDVLSIFKCNGHYYNLPRSNNAKSGLILSTPKFNYIYKNNFTNLLTQAVYEYKHFLQSNKSFRLAMTIDSISTIDTFINSLKNIITNRGKRGSDQKQTANIYAFFAHDTTVQQLFNFIGFDLKKWPPYVASFTFELFLKDDNDDDLFIRFLYNGKEIFYDENYAKSKTFIEFCKHVDRRKVEIFEHKSVEDICKVD